MKDIGPQEMAKRQWVTDKILRVICRYGFQLVEPSTLEHLETLEAKSGPTIRDEIYFFKDKADRNLGLRFDLTVGMTRMVAGRSDLPEPIKLAAIAGMWRYDEPQFARYRHFYQWDLEIYGTKEPIADAEIIAASIDILEELGLREYEVLISSRQLVDGYFGAIGITDQAQREQAIRVVDKVRKTRREELVARFSEIGVKDKTLGKVLDFITLRGTPSEALARLETLCQDALFQTGLANMKKLVHALESFGKIDKCKLDMSVVRGLDYYDGIVFEAYDKGGEDIGAILGGGRYDRLGSLYGKHDLPCTGVAGGMERLFLSLERAHLIPESEAPVKIYVVAANDTVRSHVLGLVQRIREAGVPADVDLKNRSLKNQLQYADALKIPYAVILGPREVEQQLVTVRDMRTRQEQRMAQSEFRNWLARLSASNM